MRAVLLCRVSSPDQDIKGDSLSSQKDDLLEYAKANEWNVLPEDIFSTVESTWDKDRPVLDAMLKHCERNQGKIAKVLIWRRNRAYRDVGEAIRVDTRLRELGTDTWSFREQETNPYTATAWKLRVNAYADAEKDNADRSEQSTRGMQNRGKKGYYTSKPPLGYVPDKNDNIAKFDSRLANSETGQTMADLVRLAFEMMATGLYTKEFVRQHVNQLGLRTKTGNELADATFQDTLRNPFYMGIVKFGKGAPRKNRKAKNFEVPDWSIEAKGKHTPLVSETVFHAVQSVLDGRSKAPASREQNPTFPLIGTAKCPACRSNLRGYTKTKPSGRQYRYYDCQNKLCTDRFKGKAEEMEDRYLEFLEDQKPSKEFLFVFNQVITATWKSQQENALQLAKTAKRQLEALEARKKRIRVLVEDGTYSQQDYVEAKAEVETGIAEAKATLHQAERESADMDSVIEYGLILMSKPEQVWFMSSPEERDLINKALFPDGVYYENGVYRTRQGTDFKALTAAFPSVLLDGSANGNRTRI